MMKLNQLDLQVSNVKATRDFFETFFDFHCSYARAEIAILEDEDGFAMAVSNLNHAAVPHYPSDFHIGFMLDNVEKVRKFYDRLKYAGIQMKYELMETGTSLSFMCYAPDAIPIRMSAPLKA
jgi:catechol 2,3-dioxygenase-like lactoylglutathione lyase family enzyme